SQSAVTSLAASGTINMGNGSKLSTTSGVDLTGTLTATASLGGSATISGNLKNAGLISFAGSNYSTLNVTGNYNQWSTGTLQMRIWPSGANDILNVSGTATLDGTLGVTATGTLSTPGQSWALIGAASFSGSFATLNFPTPPAGRSWTTSFVTLPMGTF